MHARALEVLRLPANKTYYVKAERLEATNLRRGADLTQKGNARRETKHTLDALKWDQQRFAALPMVDDRHKTPNGGITGLDHAGGAEFDTQTARAKREADIASATEDLARRRKQEDVATELRSATVKVVEDVTKFLQTVGPRDLPPWTATGVDARAPTVLTEDRTDILHTIAKVEGAFDDPITMKAALMRQVDAKSADAQQLVAFSEPRLRDLKGHHFEPGRIRWGTSPATFAASRDVTPHITTGVSLLALFLRDDIERVIDRELEAHYSQPGLLYMTPDDRKAELAALRAKLADNEHAIAEAVWAAAGEDGDVLFPLGLSAAAILGVDEELLTY